jgi:hypothetical protein
MGKSCCSLGIVLLYAIYSSITMCRFNACSKKSKYSNIESAPHTGMLFFFFAHTRVYKYRWWLVLSIYDICVYPGMFYLFMFWIFFACTCECVCVCVHVCMAFCPTYYCVHLFIHVLKFFRIHVNVCVCVHLFLQHMIAYISRYWFYSDTL